MTQPNPSDAEKAAAEAKAKAEAEAKAKAEAEAKAKGAKVKPLDVVQYTHRDPIFGGEHQAVGVVREVPDGGSVTIRPLDHHVVLVDPADIAGVITADDV